MKVEITREQIVGRIIQKPEGIAWDHAITPEMGQLHTFAREIAKDLIEREIICLMSFRAFPCDRRHIITSDITAEGIARRLTADGHSWEPYGNEEDKAFLTFKRVWNRALKKALARGLVFRYRRKLYRTKDAFEKAKRIGIPRNTVPKS